MERPGNSDKSEALGEARNQAQSRAASRSERAGSVFIAWPKRAGRTALSLLVVSFLVQALALSLFISPVAEAANQPTSGSQSVASADPTTPTPAPQVRQPDKNSDGPRISFADEQKLHPSVPEEKRIVPPPAARPAVAAGPPPKMNIASNFQPDTHPNLNPHFINTYYANRNFDDAGAGITDCTTSSNTDCSLRSAITVANGDGHGTTQDLVLLLPYLTNYGVNSSLPTLKSYITLSNTSDQSCPGGLANSNYIFNSGIMPADSDILTLSGNDVISGIITYQATRDGIVLAGSNNILECGFSFANLQNGVNIIAGATNNQIGVAGNGGTIGNVDFVSIGNGSSGILISGVGASGNVIKNVGIGFSPPNSGSPNGTGITIAGGATNNRIGSATNPQQYVNLIDYNTNDGVDISDTGTNGNFVTGSYIGVDKTGLTLAANTYGPLRIVSGANNNTIGGDRAGGFGNLIAGGNNEFSNVIVASNANVVQGNVISLKADFSGTFTNAGNGIEIFSGGDNTQILGNIIGGNAHSGIQIDFASNISVYGNYIGTDPTATRTNLGNALDGIYIANGSSNNQLGGPGAGQANYIGANGYSGIIINGNGTNNNKVQSNVIGVKGDFSGLLSNGTSVGTRTGAAVCTPGSGSGGTPDIQSENCQGVFITASGSSAGPTGNIIGGDSRAGLGNLIASTASKYIATGVMLDFASGNTVQGNSIGARIAGGTITGYPAPTNSIGIWLVNSASNNQLGGDSSLGQGNLIGSVYEGVNLENFNFTNPFANPLGPISGNKLQGNAVGVDFGGNSNPGLAIGLNGFSLHDPRYAGVSNNLIGVDYSGGSPNPKLGNLIGNTGSSGIAIYANLNNKATANQFNGNYIGVKPDGSAGAGNNHGIVLNSTTNSQVQGNYIGAANLPVNNASIGLTLQSQATNATIVSNYIGTNGAGADLHNTVGVVFQQSTTYNVFSQNIVGRNTVQGVQLTGGATNQNIISQNSIFGNGGPGINLNYAAANPNGIVGGSTTGPNNQAAKPTITAATLSKNTLKVSGTTNPGSSVEVFVADNSGIPQGQIYLATVSSASVVADGTFTDVSVPIASGVIFPPSPKLVATSTLLTPSIYAGSTSQFSDAFNNPTLIGYLSVTPTSLNFGATQGGSNPAAQTANLTANFANVNFSSNIVYGTGASGWLTVNPASGTANAGTPVAITFAPTTGSLAAGTYTATVTFTDTANPADTDTVTITFVVSGVTPTSYIYNLPLLANNADTPVGHITTFITFQNLSASAAATVNVQYYAIANGNAGPAENPISIPAKGQTAIASAIPSGSSYGGIVTSSQPLNLVVSEALGAGGSAYNVAATTASTLYSPLALNGQYGFTTSMIVFNAAGTGTATGQIQFFDETGAAVPGATQTLNIPAHASQTFNQAVGGSGLNSSHPYWAKIVGAAGSQLTAQVIEFGPANFVATFNAIAPAQVQSTLYAPAVFNGQFNFVTGIALANPNGAMANLTISYFNAAGTQRLQTSKTIPANGVIGVFQPNEAGLPSDVTSAVISSNQPLISTVNERGPGTISGTYVGLASGSTNVALPVMAKGFASFITGATVLNTGSSPATLTFTYYNQAGTQAGPTQNQTIAPNASFLVFQGDAAQALPSGFFGTAIISSNQPLLVTTNALQTGTGLFYTYTEPSS